MDEIVKAALKKWPNVPHAYGWLGLDARGDWYLRDERAQAAGRFPQVKGSRIELPKLQDFIGRNYERDERGCWFFQNGPQRVYVELEAAPWILRVEAQGARTHTGQEAKVLRTFTDESGRLFAATSVGLGLVHTQDMHAALDRLEAGDWPSPEETRLAVLVERSGDRLSPQAWLESGG